MDQQIQLIYKQLNMCVNFHYFNTTVIGQCSCNIEYNNTILMSSVHDRVDVFHSYKTHYKPQCTVFAKQTISIIDVIALCPMGPK